MNYLNLKNLHQILFLLLFISSSSLKSQTPIGLDIIGSSSNISQLGWAVDMNQDGNRLVVSAPLYINNISDEGLVQIYELIGGTWTQLGNDIYGLSTNERSGNAVAMNNDGTRIIIGSHRGSINSTHQGHSRIFEWNGTNWTQMGSTIFGDLQDYSGSSVSINGDGNIIVIGSPYNDDNGPQAGLVKTYEWSGSQWIQMGSDLLGDNESDGFGAAISINNQGDRLVVSSPSHDTPENSAGQLKIFEWSGTEWMQMGNDIYGTSEYFALGAALDINDDGTRIAASALGTSFGHIRIFEWDGNQWQQLGNDIIADTAGDIFGGEIALNGVGNRLAVGAYLSDENGTDSGLVRILDYNGNDWIQNQTDIYGDSAYDRFGSSVSMDITGTRLSVGARGYNNGTGLLRVYELNLLGLEDFAFLKEKISFFPNPVKNDVIINNINKLEISFASLYDANGKMIQLFDINDNAELLHLNISKFPSGFYTLFINGDNEQTRFKLIKE
jgi:hypothetical protein